MSFQNSSIKKIFFAEQYGNRGRTWSPIDYVLRTSAANKNPKLKTGRDNGTMGDGSFVFSEGKKRKVQLSYFPIQCDVEGSNTTKLCDAPDEVIQPAQVEFEVTQKTTTKKYSINAEDIRLTDNNTWDFSGAALEIIGSIMPAARKLLAEDLTAYLVAKAGKHADGNIFKRLTPAVGTDGAVNPLGGRIQIDKAYMDAGLESPYVMGGSEVYYWKNMLAIGGQQLTGAQINRINSENVWYDDNILENIGGDAANGGHVIAIDPQVFKFITYSNNAGLFRTDLANITDMDRLYKTSGGADFILGIFTDPKTGLIWDMYLNFDKCASWNDGNPGWTVFLRLEWDMFIMPPVACNIPEYNGITRWRTCPEKIATCPSGDTPSPAVTATVRSWTPGDTTFSAYQATIGGINNTYETPVVVSSLATLAALMNDATGNVYEFYVNSGAIKYNGVSNISVSFNNGELTGTFA